MAAKKTTAGLNTVPSKGRQQFAGTPKGREPRPMFIDYKDIPALKRYVTSQGKLQSRKRTGLSNPAQAALARAVKRARFMGLLPYVPE